MNEPPPAEILGRLRPIPTYTDRPSTVARDIDGVDVRGGSASLSIVGSRAPVLLIFLSADCLGCRDLWDTDALSPLLPSGVRVVIVTRGPEREDADAVSRLSKPGADVVMSTSAFEDYRVFGPPFLAVVAGGVVRTEGVAWGVEETVRATRIALEVPPG